MKKINSKLKKITSKKKQVRKRYPRANRLSFPEWLKAASPNLNWDWAHLKAIYGLLEEFNRSSEKRAMIFMPPRHGKSETLTVHYSAYRLEKDPKLRLIIASYNQKLANRFSRKVRSIVKTRGLKLNESCRAAAEWETEKGGGVRAIGIGGGITGFGAQLIIIDDPVKSRSHAESANIRQSTWDWFNDDLYTRLEPGGEMILIQTRWHEDDLAGRLIKEMEENREQWRILSLPALAEENDPLGRKVGEALCPERFDEAALKRIRRRLGSYSFSALYQQRPQPYEGGIFRRSWFERIVETAPKNLRWVRAYDLAVSTKTTADYTASFRCAFDRETGDLYIADGFRARIEFPEQRRFIKEKIAQERNTLHAIESSLHGKAFVQELQREVRYLGRSIRAVRVDEDKITRAHAWTARAEAGKVVLVRGAWIDEFLEEVCSFPFGRHDDQVDAVSLAVQMLERWGSKRSAGF